MRCKCPRHAHAQLAVCGPFPRVQATLFSGGWAPARACDSLRARNKNRWEERPAYKRVCSFSLGSCLEAQKNKKEGGRKLASITYMGSSIFRLRRGVNDRASSGRNRRRGLLAVMFLPRHTSPAPTDHPPPSLVMQRLFACDPSVSPKVGERQGCVRFAMTISGGFTCWFDVALAAAVRGGGRQRRGARASYGYHSLIRIEIRRLLL